LVLWVGQPLTAIHLPVPAIGRAPRRDALFYTSFRVRHLRIQVSFINFRLVWPESPAFGSRGWSGGIDVGMSARGLVAKGVDVGVGRIGHVTCDAFPGRQGTGWGPQESGVSSRWDSRIFHETLTQDFRPGLYHSVPFGTGGQEGKIWLAQRPGISMNSGSAREERSEIVSSPYPDPPIWLK
jgi:hypothetical protein